MTNAIALQKMKNTRDVQNLHIII